MLDLLRQGGGEGVELNARELSYAGVGEQVKQLPEVPTMEQAEGPVEGLLGESIKESAREQAEV